MEVKINKEIREYSETVVLGLTVRQLACSALGAGAGTAVFLLAKDTLGREIAGWACMCVVAPFAAVGFFRYHGMRFEKFLAAFVRARFLASGKRPRRSAEPEAEPKEERA